MKTFPPELRSMLLDLAGRIERLTPNNPRRFEADKGEIAHALRMLARWFVVTGKDRFVGWRAQDASSRD